jgi:flagellar hook-basal body complex protein FliE
MTLPIDPSFVTGGPEWSIAPVESAQPAAGTGSGFGDMLGKSLQGLADSQTEAANASQALATGQASDPTAVVMAVERAQLAMQLASQIRTKAVEAAQDIFHTQV